MYDIDDIEYKFEKGQRVWWCGGFGTECPKLATIVDLGEKNGRPVYDLDNDHWAYEYQLKGESR